MEAFKLIALFACLSACNCARVKVVDDSELHASSNTTSTGASSTPALHLFEPAVEAKDLAEEMGGWVAGDDHDSLCAEGVTHKDMKEASDTSRKIAEKLQEALDGATLQGGESDCTGRVIVISNPGEDPKEACLRALAIEEELADMSVWEEATLGDKDFASSTKFTGDDDDEDEDEDEDVGKIKAATKVLAKLKKQFEFNFKDHIVTAPVVYGGYTEDGQIVGVLSMRVWT